MASLICAHFLSILLVGGLRFGPGAVLPGAGERLWVGATCLVAAGLVASLYLEARRGAAPWQKRGRLLLWLIFPGAAGVTWGLGRTSLENSPEVPAIALISGLALTVLVLRHREWATRDRTRAAWLVALRWLAVPTAVVCAGAILAPAPLANGTTQALTTYPLYAAVQLGMALVLPWTQWERDGLRPGARIFSLVILFALVHWPNPFAAAVTAAGMLLWSLAWKSGSSFTALALSMGLMATFLTQGLPDSLTGHMRVGANYVIKSNELQREIWLDGEAWRLDTAGRWSDDEGLRPWLRRSLTELEGTDPDSALVDEVARTLERLHRQAVVRWIFDAEEFRRRHDFREELRDDELRFFESTFVPYHPGHAGYEAVVTTGAGLSMHEFVDLAYRTFLGRAPSEPEYRHWPEPVSPTNRWLFMRRVVEAGGLRGWNEPENEDARERLRAFRAARGQ